MLTITEIQNLPEKTFTKQLEKMALLRTYWQINDYNNHKEKTQDFLDKILQTYNLEKWQISEQYSKIVKRLKNKQEYKELFEIAEQIAEEQSLKEKKAKDEKIEAEKKAKQEEKDKKVNTVKEILKDNIFETYESYNYVRKTGRGIDKKFNYFVINAIQYNNVIDLIDINLIYDNIIEEIKENQEIFAILNLSETINRFGKTTLNKRSFLIKKAEK